MNAKKSWVLLLMCAPAILFFFVFSYLPLPGLYLAFVNFNYAKGIFASHFVGLKNFEFVIKSGQLWLITRNAVLYNIAFILIGNAVQVMFAVMLNEIRSKLFRKVTQSIMFLPFFISVVIVALLVYDILNYDFGYLNVILSSLGLAKMTFYQMPGAWPIIIVLVNLWMGTGYGSIVYFAAITSFDSEVIEASAIDGCNAWQRIRYITLPLLKPTVIILILFSLGNILRGNFNLFYNLIGSSNTTLFPNTDIIETFVYRALMNNMNWSMSSSVNLYQSIFGFAVVMLFNWIVRRVEPEYSLF